MQTRRNAGDSLCNVNINNCQNSLLIPNIDKDGNNIWRIKRGDGKVGVEFACIGEGKVHGEIFKPTKNAKR